MKIISDKQELMDVDRAIIIGLKEDNQVVLNLQNEMSLEEVLDMMNTSLYELLNTFEKYAQSQNPKMTEKEKKKLKEELYQRAVLGFSLVIDKFHPDGKKSRFEGLTEQAVMEKQNEILMRNKNKKEKKDDEVLSRKQE